MRVECRVTCDAVTSTTPTPTERCNHQTPQLGLELVVNPFIALPPPPFYPHVLVLPPRLANHLSFTYKPLYECGWRGQWDEWISPSSSRARSLDDFPAVYAWGFGISGRRDTSTSSSSIFMALTEMSCGRRDTSILSARQTRLFENHGGGILIIHELDTWRYIWTWLWFNALKIVKQWERCE